MGLSQFDWQILRKVTDIHKILIIEFIDVKLPY